MAKIKKVKLGTDVYDIEPTNTVPLSDVAVVSTIANQGLTDTEKSNARANIGAGTSSLTLGTTATTAAKGNHTHTTTIATSSGTNELTLAHGTKYAITAGGDSFVFTTPSDNNTWRKVQLNGTDKLGTGTGTNPLNIKAGKDMSITESSGAFTFNSETNFENIGTFSELGALKTTIVGGSYTRSQAFKCIIGSTYFYGFLNVIKNSSGTVTSYNVIMWGSATIYYLTYTVSSSSWTEDIKYLSTTDHTHSGYADSGHTHDVSIAKSSATNELTLAHSTKYALTAGGQSFVFTMPSSGNTHNSHAIISGTKSDGSTQIKGSASSGDITLGDSGVTAGTYRSVTVNSKGIVVAGSSADTDTNTWRKVQLNGTDKLGTGTNTNPLNIKAGKDMSITESSGAFTFNSETNFESIGTYSELGALKTTIAGGSYTRSQAFKCIIGTDYYYGFLNVSKNSSGTITGYDIIMWKGAAIYYLSYTVSNSTWTENTKYLSTTSHTHSASTANAAPHSHTHSVTVSGTTGNNSASVTVASGSLSSSGTGGTVATGASGTATVVTGVSGGSGSLTSNTTSTDGIKYIETHTAASLGTASTADVAPNAHAHTFEWGGTTGTGSGSKITALTGVKVSAQPTVSLTANTATATGRIKYVESITHTAASLGTASTGTVSISGGSYSGTTKYMKVSTTAADTGTVGISGGSGSLTSDTTSTNGIKYVEAQGTFSAGTTPPKSASFSGTAATITPTLTGTLNGTCLTLSITGASYTPAGSVSFTAGTAPSLGAATTKYLHHTHTAASLTGTKTFATNGVKAVSLSASTTSTDGPAYTESISGSAPSLGGTKTFVTGYSSFSGGSITPTTKYLSASASGTAVSANGTASVAPFEHTHNYSGSSKTANNDGTAVTAITGYPSFSGGSATTKYLHHTHTGASASGTTTAVTGISTSKLVTTSAAKHTHTHSYGSSTALTTGSNSGSAVAAVTAVNSAKES